MELIRKIVCLILSLALGCTFIYSGYTKLLPVIETFEFTFVDIHIANWYTAPVLARLLIGFEFFLGVLLIICFRLKRFTIPITISLLLIFNIYLTVQLVVAGNDSNCGCFGEHHYFTPLQAILKNFLMVALALVVWFLFEGWQTKNKWLIPSLIMLPAFSLPFILNPVDFSYTSNNMMEKINYPLDLDPLYDLTNKDIEAVPPVDLREGKHVLAFLSLTCPHCRVAAKKFRLIKRENPAIPIYFVLNGSKEKLQDFLNDTKSQNIPFSFCSGKTFIQLSSAYLPRIYYLENTIVKRKVNYYELNQYEIERWLND